MSRLVMFSCFTATDGWILVRKIGEDELNYCLLLVLWVQNSKNRHDAIAKSKNCCDQKTAATREFKVWNICQYVYSANLPINWPELWQNWYYHVFGRFLLHLSTSQYDYQNHDSIVRHNTVFKKGKTSADPIDTANTKKNPFPLLILGASYFAACSCRGLKNSIFLQKTIKETG